MRRLRSRMAAGAFALLAALALPALAEVDAQAAIKYRENAMKALSGHMGALKRIVSGEVSMPANAAVAHALGLRGVSAHIVEMFPPGSDFGITSAKAGVWEQRGEFEQAAREAGLRAAALLEAAQGDDPALLGERFKAMGQACKGCHDQFREEE